MAQATCGTAGVSNGYGAVASNPNGDNYITYKGTYTGSQSAYNGWYKFYYKIDARSAATNKEFQDVVGYLLVEPINTGRAQVVKTSANPAISNANGNYSLANAVFGAFSTRASAEAAAEQAAKGAWGSWQAAAPGLRPMLRLPSLPGRMAEVRSPRTSRRRLLLLRTVRPARIPPEQRRPEGDRGGNQRRERRVPSILCR